MPVQHPGDSRTSASERPTLPSWLKGVLAQTLVRTRCASCVQVGLPQNECVHCGGTGMRGRCAVGEVLRVDENIAAMINEDRSPPEIQAAADYRTKAANAGSLIAAGRTTVEAVADMLGTTAAEQAEGAAAEELERRQNPEATAPMTLTETTPSETRLSTWKFSGLDHRTGARRSGSVMAHTEEGAQRAARRQGLMGVKVSAVSSKSGMQIGSGVKRGSASEARLVSAFLGAHQLRCAERQPGAGDSRQTGQAQIGLCGLRLLRCLRPPQQPGQLSLMPSLHKATSGAKMSQRSSQQGLSQAT